MVSELDVFKLQIINLENLRDLAVRSNEQELTSEIEKVLLEIFELAHQLDSTIDGDPLFIKLKER